MSDLLPPIPPGEILRQEFMAPKGMSARQLARELGIPPNRITAILNGTRAVTAATAIMLGKRFGTTPEFWMNLQTAHDLELAGHQRAYHPSELPEHIKAAIQTSRMDPKHDSLNTLMDEPKDE